MTDPTPRPTPPPPVITKCAACGALKPAAPRKHCGAKHPTCTWWRCPSKTCGRMNDDQGHHTPWTGAGA